MRTGGAREEGMYTGGKSKTGGGSTGTNLVEENKRRVNESCGVGKRGDKVGLKREMGTAYESV